MLLTDLMIVLIAYLFGAIPWGLIVVRFFSGKDIRSEGSGNVGAMNSYDITGKRYVGILVFLLDFAKGAAAVLVAKAISGGNFTSVGLAAVFVVVGHNFNALLKFRGGRGLAAATGALAFIDPFGIIVWVVMWITGYFIIKKNVHVGNVTGTIGGVILTFSAPDHVIFALQTMDFWKTAPYKWLVFFMAIVILARHVGPIINLLKDEMNENS